MQNSAPAAVSPEPKNLSYSNSPGKARGSFCVKREVCRLLSGYPPAHRFPFGICRILPVDEATASLDAQTANQVASAILGLDGLTRIVVTHDLEGSILKQYDCILALKNGTIAESGTFDELMEQKQYFYSLYTVSQ